jgi:hypothetical protein
MKLIDVLVEELPKRGGWPKRANCITQDGDLKVEPASCHPSIAKCDEDGFWFLDSSRTGGFEVDTLASDYTTAIITREQYEAALAAKNDGWIDWGGGECPVEEGVLVDVRLRNGNTFEGLAALVESRATLPFWLSYDAGADIIAYRLHKPQEAEQAKADDETDLNECIGQDAAPVWNGEGLPPVGVECEYKWQNDRWRIGKVCYISKHTVLMLEIFDGEESESAYGACDVTFRPLRTEADRKREEAVKAIMLTGWCQAAAEEIYDLVAAGKVPGMKLED